jgi:hypothetical protein
VHSISASAKWPGTINSRGSEVADAIGAKIGETTRPWARALEVANNLDSRIGRFEELLIGRAETVTSQIETRSRAATDALNARLEQLSQAIKVNRPKPSVRLVSWRFRPPKQFAQARATQSASLSG